MCDFFSLTMGLQSVKSRSFDQITFFWSHQIKVFASFISSTKKCHPVLPPTGQTQDYFFSLSSLGVGRKKWTEEEELVRPSDRATINLFSATAKDGPPPPSYCDASICPSGNLSFYTSPVCVCHKLKRGLIRTELILKTRPVKKRWRRTFVCGITSSRVKRGLNSRWRGRYSTQSCKRSRSLDFSRKWPPKVFTHADTCPTDDVR